MNPNKRMTAIAYNQPQLVTLEGSLKAIQSTQKGMPPWWLDLLVPPRAKRMNKEIHKNLLRHLICAPHSNEKKRN